MEEKKLTTHQKAVKAYYSKNPEKWRAYNKEWKKNLRDKILSLLGGKCVVCGFSDPRALQIDHINGDGCKERGKCHSSIFYNRVAATILMGKNDKYQLLCANCNWIKRAVNNETKKR